MTAARPWPSIAEMTIVCVDPSQRIGSSNDPLTGGVPATCSLSTRKATDAAPVVVYRAVTVIFTKPLHATLAGASKDVIFASLRGGVVRGAVPVVPVGAGGSVPRGRVESGPVEPEVVVAGADVGSLVGFGVRLVVGLGVGGGDELHAVSAIASALATAAARRTSAPGRGGREGGTGRP